MESLGEFFFYYLKNFPLSTSMNFKAIVFFLIQACHCEPLLTVFERFVLPDFCLLG